MPFLGLDFCTHTVVRISKGASIKIGNSFGTVMPIDCIAAFVYLFDQQAGQ